MQPDELLQTSGIGVCLVAVGGSLLQAVATPEGELVATVAKNGMMGVLLVLMSYAVVRLYKDQQALVDAERKEAAQREAREQREYERRERNWQETIHRQEAVNTAFLETLNRLTEHLKSAGN